MTLLFECLDRTESMNPGDVFSSIGRPGVARLIPTRVSRGAASVVDPGAGRVSLVDPAEHEARHVVAAKACGLSIESATIVPAPGYTGRVVLTLENFACRPLREFSDHALRELIGSRSPLIIEGAPSICETNFFIYAVVIFQVAGSGQKDLEQATTLADIASSKPAVFLNFAKADCRKILDANRHQVAAIADALLIEWTLTGAAIDEILAGMSPAMRAEKLRRKQWMEIAA